MMHRMRYQISYKFARKIAIDELHGSLDENTVDEISIENNKL